VGQRGQSGQLGPRQSHLSPKSQESHSALVPLARGAPRRTYILLGDTAALLGDTAALLGDSASLFGDTVSLLGGSVSLLRGSASLMKKLVPLIEKLESLLRHSVSLFGNTGSLFRRSSVADLQHRLAAPARGSSVLRRFRVRSRLASRLQ